MCNDLVKFLNNRIEKQLETKNLEEFERTSAWAWEMLLKSITMEIEFRNYSRNCIEYSNIETFFSHIIKIFNMKLIGVKWQRTPKFLNFVAYYPFCIKIMKVIDF